MLDFFLEYIEKVSPIKLEIYKNLISYCEEMLSISILPNIELDTLLGSSGQIILEQEDADSVEKLWLTTFKNELEKVGIGLEDDFSLKDLELVIEGLVTYCNLDQGQKLDYVSILENDEPNEAIANLLSQILTISPFRFLEFLDITEEFLLQLREEVEENIEEVDEPLTLQDFVKRFRKNELDLLEDLDIELPSPIKVDKINIISIINKSSMELEKKEMILKKYYNFTEIELKLLEG